MTAPADQLYTRIRGSVRGPYAVEQLRSLVKRGVLGRMHELSPDGSTWTRADAYSDLFCFATPSSAAPPSGDALPADEDPHIPHEVPVDEYYYYVAGEVLGPVSRPQLRALAEGGKLLPHDLVAEGGSRQWQPLCALIDFGGAGPQVAASRPAGPGAPRSSRSGVLASPPLLAVHPGRQAAGAERTAPVVHWMAAASLILALVWMCGAGSLAAIVLGFLAERQISDARDRFRGRGLSLAGIGLGIVGLGLAAIGLLVVLSDWSRGE